MSKRFWPIVMWFADVQLLDFIYYPSTSHHFIGDDDDTEHLATIQRDLPSFPTWEEARAEAIRMIGPNAKQAGVITLFRPWVIESPTQPDLNWSGKPSERLTLLVRKFAVNEDGDVAANVQHLTGEE